MGRITVEHSWDRIEGLVDPKSRLGRRTVPIVAVLRDDLDEHLLRTKGTDTDHVFTARTSDRPFDPSTVHARARSAWDDAELDGITLQECRHTFATLMIAAGVNIKALSTYMGHSSIQVTYDIYGHLFPGNEEEAAALANAYLERANTATRIAQVTA